MARRRSNNLPKVRVRVRARVRLRVRIRVRISTRVRIRVRIMVRVRDRDITLTLTLTLNPIGSLVLGTTHRLRLDYDVLFKHQPASAEKPIDLFFFVPQYVTKDLHTHTHTHKFYSTTRQ